MIIYIVKDCRREVRSSTGTDSVNDGIYTVFIFYFVIAALQDAENRQSHDGCSVVRCI